MHVPYFMISSQKAQLRFERQLIYDQKKLRKLEKVRFQSGADDIEELVSLDQAIAKDEENLPNISNIISENE